MSALSNSTVPLVPAFPAGIDAHWETERRLVWDDKQYANEERELVYEISWVPEIGVWRRFLRSQHKVRS